MAKVKMGSWAYTEQDLDDMFEEARIRGKVASSVEPQAKSVHYDRAKSRVIVDLKNGATFIFPSEIAQGLRSASTDDVAQVELGPRGASLHWEKLDVDFSLVGLMSGVFGNSAWTTRLKREGGTGTRMSKPSRTAVRDGARSSQDGKRAPSRSKLAHGFRSRTERQP